MKNKYTYKCPICPKLLRCVLMDSAFMSNCIRGHYQSIIPCNAKYFLTNECFHLNNVYIRHEIDQDKGHTYYVSIYKDRINFNFGEIITSFKINCNEVINSTDSAFWKGLALFA